MRICIGILLLTFCHWAHAVASVKIVDQNNQPVANAVVLTKAPNNKAIDDPLVMDQVNRQFKPQVLVVQAGSSVTFPNSDNIRHHVYSFSAAKPFEIKLYKGVPARPVTFPKSGVVELGCNIHDQMIGYIYVADNQSSAVSNEAGEVYLPQLSDSVRVWHPRLSLDRTQHFDATLKQKDQDGIYLIQLKLLPEREKKVSKFKKKFGKN